jgi:hypothetical protein
MAAVHFTVLLEDLVRGALISTDPESACAPTTVRGTLAGKRTSVPARAGLLERICTRARRDPPSKRSSRISTRPPLSLAPNRRAGTTRVSLRRARSPAASRPGRSIDLAVRYSPERTVELQKPPAAASRRADARDQRIGKS